MKQQNNAPANQSTYQEMLSHTKLSYFIVYSVSYMLYGQMYTALGPMFPYLAAKQGKLQTDYSFLFSCRAVGFVAGSLSVRMLSHMMTLHHFAALGISLMSFFSILFYFAESIEMRGAFVLLSSIGCSYQDIILNLLALKCFEGEKAGMWLQMLHGFFGIGGLVGPFVVYLFQFKALSVIGTFSLSTIFFYFYFTSPENEQKTNPQNQNQNQNYNKNKDQLPQNPPQPQNPIPQTSIYIISAAFFFTVGQQTTYGGWISSYAVLYGFAHKQHATVFSSVYWISITFFRFFLATVQGSASQKVELMGLIGVINSVVSYFVIFYVDPEFGLYSMSLLYGLCNSVLYALLLTIPEQFGYKLNVKQTTSFVIWASLGQGSLAVIMGKFMGWFSYNWLIYGMMIMDFVIILLMRLNKGVMISAKEQANVKEEGYMIESSLLGRNGGRMSQCQQMFQLLEMRKIGA